MAEKSIMPSVVLISSFRVPSRIVSPHIWRVGMLGLSRGGRRRQLLYPTEPRFRSEKSAADAKLEKTSLSAGGFLRVPYGFGIGLWLHTRQAIIKITNHMAHHSYSIRIIFCFFPNLVEKIVIIV